MTDKENPAVSQPTQPFFGKSGKGTFFSEARENTTFFNKSLLAKPESISRKADNKNKKESHNLPDHINQKSSEPEQTSGTEKKLGTYYYQASENISMSVDVKSRSITEWIYFLKEEADTVRGNVELNAFMATAMGHYNATGQQVHIQKYEGKYPSKPDALKLMAAFLLVGEDMDLPDYRTEGNPYAMPFTSGLMSDFNAMFAGEVIIKATQVYGELNTSQFNSIKSYASEAESQSDQSPWQDDSQRKNPVHTLIASALGVAFGATATLNTYNEEPSSKNIEDNIKIQKLFDLITNSGKIIKASIESAAEAQQTKKNMLINTFRTASATVGVALAATTGPIATIAANALNILLPTADSFLEAILSGNGPDELRKMYDNYNENIDKLVNSNPPLISAFARDAKDAFERGLDF